MRSFDVIYEGSEGSSDSITVGHRKLDVRMVSDGSGRSLGNENSSQKDNTEEFMDTRGCNTCVPQLQMSSTILGYSQSRNDLSLDSNSSNGSLVNARTNHKNTGHDENYSRIHGPPPPYPGRDNNYERDQAMPMRAGDFQLYEQYSGQKMSVSSISSSSFSGLSQDDKLAPHSSNWAEFMGKPPPSFTSKNSNPTPSSYSTSESSLCAFLARDPDILSLNGLMISPGGSVMTMMSTVISPTNAAAKLQIIGRVTPPQQPQTKAATKFNFSRMTTKEMQATERLIREANSRGNVRVNGRPPLDTRHHQPCYQPEYEQNPLKITKNYHLPPRYPSHFQTPSYSSSSTHSDMIQLNMPTRSSTAPNETEFVIFDENRRDRALTHTERANDMIPLQL